VTGSLEGAGKFSAWKPPADWIDLPVVGWLIRAALGQGPLTILMLVSVVVLQVLLFRSRWGLRTRAVGEHPKAAETAGIDVIRVRYRNVVLGGAFAGLAGAYLSLEATGSFQDGMTAGRGFIALAALIVGRWTPVGGFLAALLFATSLVLGQVIDFRPPEGQLGDLLGDVPSQFWDVLPYVVTIVVLAGVVGRSIPPAADGRPYERESAT
jgi:simple sugar transport system permease protein